MRDVKNTIIEAIVKLIVNKSGLLFDFIAGKIGSNEQEWDDYALRMLCRATTDEYMEGLLRAECQKSETEIDDNLLDEWLDFARTYLDPDISLEDAKVRAEELGFVGLIK